MSSKKFSDTHSERNDEFNDDQGDNAGSNPLNNDLDHIRDHAEREGEDSDENNSEDDDEDSDEVSDEDDDPNDKTHRAAWLNSVKAYVEETRGVVDLGYRELKTDEIISVFQSFTKSQVPELLLYRNNLENEVQHFSELLAQTKLKTLTFIDCKFTSDDLLRLMKAIKDSVVTDLQVTLNKIQFDVDLAKEFVALVHQSLLTKLNISMNFITSEAGVLLVQSLPSTVLTHLNLSGITAKGKSRSTITSIISKLPNSAITALDVTWCHLSLAEIKELSEILKDSKLETLILNGNNIKDAGVKILTRGLIHSKITDLHLNMNGIEGHNNLGHYLKYTRIKTLDLSSNSIKHDEMFDFPDFLKGSSVNVLYISENSLGDKIGQKLMESLKSTEVTELSIGGNDFGTDTILAFCKSLKFTNLTEVHFSSYDIPYETISDLGSCLKGSKLKILGLDDAFGAADPYTLSTLVDKTKGSSLTTLDLSTNKFHFDNYLAKSLKKSTLTHLQLNCIHFYDEDFSQIGSVLKTSNITHLELQQSAVGDEEVKILAKYLKGSQLVSLDLRSNAINTPGAKTLANVLKDTNLLSLDLRQNYVKNDGCHYLAEKISSTFMTVLHVSSRCMSRNSHFAIDAALWENRKIVQQLNDAFKRIAPEANSDNFQFESKDDSSDFSSLFKDCLFLYSTVVKRPSAANVLAQEKTVSLTKSQITTLMLDQFPTQFAMFIGRNVKVKVTQRVEFLKQSEELGLSNITELLLQHRPLYLVDEDQDILHPFVYKLMHKYKQPIVNSSIKPGAEEKLVNYFTTHKELEGASDVVQLLRPKASTAARKSRARKVSK